MVIELEYQIARRPETFALRLQRDLQPEKDRYEEAVGLSHLIASRGEYIQFLKNAYTFWAPLEEKIASVLDLVEHTAIQWEERRRAPFMLMDLLSLGLRPRDFGSLANELDLPAIETPLQALGAIWVLEELQEGGDFICQLLAQRLALSREKGARFFSSYGNSAETMKGRLRRTVESWAISEGAESIVVASARETYDKMQRWRLRTELAAAQLCG